MLKKVLTIFTSIFILVAIITNVVLPVYAVNTTMGQKPPIKSGVYCIQSMVGKDPEYNKDLLMDVQNVSKEDNAIIQVWLKHYDLGNDYAKLEYLCQEFYLRYDYSDGCYTIIPMHTVINGAGEVIEDSPKCIGVENPTAGTNVVQRDLCFDDNFKWVIDKCEDGQIEFTLKSTLQSNNKLKLDLCLKDNGKYGINSRVKVDNANGKSSQKFKLSNWEPSKKNLSEPNAKKAIESISSRMKGLPNKVPSGVYCIQNMVGNNMFLDIYGPFNVDNGILQIYTKHKDCPNKNSLLNPAFLNQEFYLWRHEDGYYTIIPMYTVFKDGKNINWDFVKCIGLENVNGGAGTKVTQRKLSFEDNCKWKINYIGNGKYKFVLKSNGLTLDVCRSENGYGIGSRLQISNGSNSDAQKFKLSFWRPSEKQINNTESRRAIQKDIPEKLNEYLKKGPPPLTETVKSGAYNIQSMVWDNRFLDVQGKQDNTDYNYDDQGILQIYPKNKKYPLYHNNIIYQIGNENFGSRNQQFYLWRHKDGYYTIIPMHTIWRLDGQCSLDNVKCIGLENVNGGVGTQVRQRDLSFNDSCKWAVDKLSDGTFEFTLKSNGLKMEVCGIEANSLVQINTENYSPSQRFKFNSCNVFGKDGNCCEDINQFLEVKNLSITTVKPEIKEITKQTMSLCESLETVDIPSTVEKITDDAFSNNNNITNVICDSKWLCKFKKDKLKLIVVKPSIETGNFNIIKKDFEGCSNLQVLRLDCDKFKEEEADDLLKKLQIEEGALDKCTNIQQFSVYSEEDNKIIDLTLNNKFAYYFNVDRYVEITVPDGIQKIRADRFKDKKYLVNLTLPNSVKEIEKGAFEGCENLLHINLPKGITKIPAGAFKDCKNLRKLTLPNSVKEIEEGAFEGCENLQEINLPEEITKIPARAFKDCKKILKLNLSKDTNEIQKNEIKDEIEGDDAKDATIAGELILPNSIKEIGESAFEGCENLQEISLPEGITEIPDRAFKNCKYLRTLHLHDKIEQMGDEAFEGCNLLHSGLSCFSEKQKQLFKKFDKEVIVPSDFNLTGEELEKFKEKFCNAEVIRMPDFYEYDAERYTELFKIDKDIKARVITCTPDALEKLAPKANFESIFISEDTACIDKKSFEHCKNVKVVGIPTFIDEIDEGTFDNCNSIETVKCPLRLLGRFNKTKLENIIINEEICTNLENFDGCKNLKFLMLPDRWVKTPEIINYIFLKCSNLNEIRSESGEKIEKPEIFKAIESCKICSIPNNVKKISKNDYDKYDEATTLTIPQTVESIEDGAFENFSKLKTVKADPKWLKKLPNMKIEELTVPAWVSEVHEKDFENCYNIKRLIFESAETKLCGENGYECDAFKNIKRIRCSLKTASTMSEETKNNLKVLDLIEGTKQISDKDLSEFYRLEGIILPETLESIGTNAFKNNKNLCQVNCKCSLLKYLPKDQIRCLLLKHGEKDKLPKDELKEFKNLQTIYTEDAKKLLWSRKEDLNDQDNKIQGDRFEPEKVKELEDEQQAKSSSIKPSNGDQPPVNSSNTQPSNTGKPPVKLPNTQPSNGDQPPINSHNTQPSNAGKLPVNSPNTQQCNKINKDYTTTMEDLVKADPGNKKYEKYVNEIKEAINSNKEGSVSKDTSLQGISDSIIYVCSKIKKSYKRTPYTVQILTVLRLADEILNGKGAVAQVKTGEGKSFIIAVLSIVLALKGRTIDVITSTTELAQRDEKDQKKYYELFQKELSGVFYSRSGDEKRCGDNVKFDESGYNSEVLNRSIVYSTLHNFESAYLHGLFSKDGVRKKRLYDVAIVDEVDNMLLDKSSSPTILSHGIKVLRHKDILTIVYLLQKENETKILAILKDIFPKFYIDIESVRKMKQAAQIAYSTKEKEEYVVENGTAILMDGFTGATQPGSRWKDQVQEMLEVKHMLRVRDAGVSFAAVDHYIFFRKYKSLTGLTGTIGKAEERNAINKIYGINIFEVLRNKKENKDLKQLDRPATKKELNEKALLDIREKISQGRPVLVIFNYIDEVEDFSKYLRTNGITNFGIVNGLNAENDQKAIERAGKSGRVTVATIIGGRGTDIKIEGMIEQIGGLHVIVVPQMRNQRVLEQAIGRSGRNGQKGSATIFEPSMLKTQVAEFNILYEHLDKLQNNFATHIRKQWSWFYDEEEVTIIDGYPFNLEVDDVLKIAGASMKNSSSKGKKRSAIMTAWGVFFTEISNNTYRYNNWNNCQVAYNNFISKIDNWVVSVDSIDWGDLAIKGLVIGGTIAVSVALPEIAAAYGASVVVGAAVTGAVLGGLSELHAQISRGEEINWGSALTRTFGGALKGATLTIPGVGVLSRVVSYASIAGTENYWDSSFKGDSSVDALVQSYAMGAVESVTANTINAVTNGLLGKFAGGGKVKNEVKIAGSNASKEIVKLSEAELENIYGGASNPDWKPMQEHHFITNKSQKYTPEFEKIINKYGLKLDNSWNKQLMPHQGRHPYAYHDYMLEKLNKIDEIAQGNKEIFLDLFEEVKTEISKNPNMLYKSFWKELAQNGKNK